jgi:DNA methylase
MAAPQSEWRVSLCNRLSTPDQESRKGRGPAPQCANRCERCEASAAQPGCCFQARSHMSGMRADIPARSSNPSRPPASTCALKSSGPRTGSLLAGAITIGSTNPAGTRYAVRGTSGTHWSGDRKQSTLWTINAREDDGHGHGTQKPVECMRHPIENNSSPGQAIYEPFSGSGTTIIAAEMTGRSCFAIEIDPAYVDVAILRWQAFTGEDARLDQDGRSFAEVAAERASIAPADGTTSTHA